MSFWAGDCGWMGLVAFLLVGVFWVLELVGWVFWVLGCRWLVMCLIWGWGLFFIVLFWVWVVGCLVVFGLGCCGLG